MPYPKSGLFRTATCISLLGTSFLFAPSSEAAPDAPSLATSAPTAAERQWTASVRWENDIFGGTDRFYTNGLSLGLSHTGPSWMDPVADRLPWGDGRRTVGYDLTQSMATPVDMTLAVPSADDRPYAGILTVGLALHVERSSSYHGLRLVTGIVGPSSLAEEVQRGVHHVVGSEQPQGWDHQLDDEPVVNLAYEYRHRFRLAGKPDGWSVEALPSIGGMLGNLLTQAQVGGVIRFGYNVPSDFGVTLVRGMAHLPPPQSDGRSTSRWGFSFYAGGVANVVVRDMLLDGNTFEDSPSVEKKLFVPAGGVGVTVGNGQLLTSLTYIFWGREFDGQRSSSKFGAIAASYLF